MSVSSIPMAVLTTAVTLLDPTPAAAELDTD